MSGVGEGHLALQRASGSGNTLYDTIVGPCLHASVQAQTHPARTKGPGVDASKQLTVVTDAPASADVVTGRLCVCAARACGQSAPSAQLCCEPETAPPKIKVFEAC